MPLLKKCSLKAIGFCFTILHTYAYLKLQQKQRVARHIKKWSKRTLIKGMRVIKIYTQMKVAKKNSLSMALTNDSERLYRKSFFTLLKNKIVK